MNWSIRALWRWRMEGSKEGELRHHSNMVAHRWDDSAGRHPQSCNKRQRGVHTFLTPAQLTNHGMSREVAVKVTKKMTCDHRWKGVGGESFRSDSAIWQSLPTVAWVTHRVCHQCGGGGEPRWEVACFSLTSVQMCDSNVLCFLHVRHQIRSCSLKTINRFSYD